MHICVPIKRAGLNPSAVAECGKPKKYFWLLLLRVTKVTAALRRILFQSSVLLEQKPPPFKRRFYNVILNGVWATIGRTKRFFAAAQNDIKCRYKKTCNKSVAGFVLFYIPNKPNQISRGVRLIAKIGPRTSLSETS